MLPRRSGRGTHVGGHLSPRGRFAIGFLQGALKGFLRIGQQSALAHHSLGPMLLAKAYLTELSRGPAPAKAPLMDPHGRKRLLPGLVLAERIHAQAGEDCFERLRVGQYVNISTSPLKKWAYAFAIEGARHVYTTERDAVIFCAW